jgi:hypothetical protein
VKTNIQPKLPWELARIAEHTEEPWRLYEWHEEVSRTEVQTPEGDVIKFVLRASGMGIPPAVLSMVVKGVPEAHLRFGIDREEMGKLAKWLVESMYLLNSLWEKKEQEIEKAQKELARIHRHSSQRKWTKKSESE